MKKKKLIKRIILIVVLVVIAGGGYYMMQQIANASIPTADVVWAKPQEIKSYITASGNVATNETKTFIGPGAQVTIDKVNVKVHDIVEKGDLLVEFDISDLEYALRVSAYSIENAQLSYDQQMRTYEQLKLDLIDVEQDIERADAKIGRLMHNGIVSQEDSSEYLKTDANLKSYEARKESLEKQLDQYNFEQIEISKNNIATRKLAFEQDVKNLEEARKNIYAEFDGIVTSVSAMEGMPGSGQMLTMSSTESIVITFEASRYDIEKIVLGQPVIIESGQNKLEGSVTKIAPVATMAAGIAAPTVKVEITPNDPQNILILGTEVDIDILTFDKKAPLALPVEAIKTDKGGDYCYIAVEFENPAAKEGDKAVEQFYKFEKQYITIGGSSEIYIEVLDGLSGDERIAVSPPVNILAMPFFRINEIDNYEAAETSSNDMFGMMIMGG